MFALPEEDLFCVPVKIGYGKGAVNPVSDSTTFFKPRKHTTSLEDSAALGREDYHVGILPQGSTSTLLILLIPKITCIYLCFLASVCEPAAAN